MLVSKRIVRKTAARIGQAIDHTVNAIADGRVEQEPAITDRMLGAIEQSLWNFNIEGVQWGAKTLTDRGPGAQESRFGADFFGVLDIQIDDFSIRKGFLAQAKRDTSRNKKELKEQCARMLRISLESYVFVYGADGIRVFPASSVVANNGSWRDLYSRKATRFFEGHFECFIGDPSIYKPHIKNLEELARSVEARSGIEISAQSRFRSAGS